MNERHSIPAQSSHDATGDWLDRLLERDAAERAADYIPDAGFAARVMSALPAADALPAWRRPAVTALWLIAATLLAFTLPGTVLEVAREAFKLFAARPFSLSTVALVIGAIGIATWTGAAVALQRD
jgi:hypothetical protein